MTLSPYQVSLGRLVALGYSNRDIAEEMKISESAVKNFLHTIFDKTGCWNRVELANHMGKHYRNSYTIPEGLAEVLITDELSRRCPRDISRIEVDQSLRDLSKYLSTSDAQGLIRSLTDVAFRLCDAGSSGLSVLAKSDTGEDIFRWDAVSGALAGAVGGTTPRNWSPCGTTLDIGSPQLFLYQARFFTYFAKANPPIVEGLVLPIRLPGGVDFGTLWIASHDTQRQFTNGEVEVMTSLCSFTMAAARMMELRSDIAPVG